MKKKILLVFLLVFSLAMFSACKKADDSNQVKEPDKIDNNVKNTENTNEGTEGGAENTANFEGVTLNVVATSDKYVTLFDKYTEKTGAKVEFLSMSSGEVISRMKAEGKAMADVWFGGGLDAFMAADADGLLEHYVSVNSADIPDDYKDAEGAWIAKGLTVVGFLVNNDILAEKNLPVPMTWAELADPMYEGEVIMSNPAVSGTNYAAIKGLLDLFGDEGWNYIEKLNANIPFYGKRGKDPQEKTVQGEFAIGIIPVDKSAFDVAQDNNLTVVYPADGIPWVPEGVAIFKDAQNLDAAKAFIDFMLTPEGQMMIAELDGKDTAQIVKPDVEGLSLGLPVDALIKQDLSTFGSERENILNRFKDISQGKIVE